MGFDNECILNIQSLAGEYFCPVCRLLVYPNEALQSQCTHLYCKPCLTYVVSTTRACPYDGYLVTEADSKPLSESNKSLAETIGKIAVHCLFHRSGCTWKGSLSDCTSHCSGCAFGNSPVVCNRCGTQIAHRQVQEHALTCPGVQPQAQQAGGASASATSTAATGDQTQSATQAAVVTSQTQPSQTAAAVPGKDLTKQSISSSQAQPVVQAAVPTPEQWYQQQQQYQQFYQPYPGYDPYQQQYQQHYPYQLQPQVYLQPQPQSQPLASHNQAAVATQPQNQTQINPQQQVPSFVPPQSQIQTQTHPSTPGQPTPQPYSQPQVPPQPHPQPVQMPQYQQPNSQMQHPQPQIQQQSQSQAQSQPHIPTSQPHSLSQPNQTPNSNFQSQTQHPSAHAVTGHHSFPQFNNDPQMQIGGLQQYPVHAEPQVVPTQSQNPIQMQIQLPKQAPLMRPPHSGTTTPSQQQPALLPSPGQVQIIPPAQQQQPAQQPYFQQPGQPMQQRPIMQPVQQTFPQQHYLQQLPMAPQLHPTGQSHLFPPQTHAYLQQPMQHAKPPNIVGRPPMLNQGVQAQPYSQYGGSIIRPSYPGTNQQATNQNMLKANNQKSEIGLNSTDLEHKSAEDIGDQSSEKVQPIIKEDGVGSTLKDLNNGKSVEVVAEDTKGVLKIAPEKMNNFIVENKDVDNSLLKMSPAKAVERPEEQGGYLVKEAVSGSDGVSKGIPAASTQIPGNPAPGGEVKLKYPHGVVFPHPNQVQAHQLPGPPPLLQVPPPGPSHPTQGPGAPQTHFRPQTPGHPHPHDGIPGSALPFERRPSQYGPGRQSSELQSVAPQGPFIPGPSAAFSLSQGEATRAQSSVVLPPRAFDSHGGTMAGATPHGPEMFPNQRPSFMDSKGFDPHFPGSLDYGALSQPSGIHPNMTRMNGSRFFDSPSAVGSRDERFNPFSAGSKHQPEFEDDLKQFPRPFDRGPHGMTYNGGLKMDSGVGSVSSKFLSPYSGGGANDAGERLGGRHEDSFGRMDPTRGHLDFFGPGPGYGWHHMDNWASRSPGRELPGIFSRGFGGPGPDDIHGRGLGRFGETFGGTFHESRFSMLPRHLRRGEFEGPHNMGMGDQLRNDLIEQDGFSGPLRWREHMGGPHGYSHLVEPVGFGAHPRYSRIREMGGPGGFDSFGRGDGPSFPRLGEPGFRSRFSPHGFPTDNGIFTGDLAFDKSRKRKPPVMGWCRICKVDCETVEGLDLHSQTKEHQKMAMEIVVTIKKNAKKQKLTSGDQSSPGDASQPRSVGTEDHGKNN